MRRPPDGRVAGFTMVEFLTVLLIVVLLVALLAPVSREAFRAARSTEAIVSGRQVWIALQQYEQDSDTEHFGRLNPLAGLGYADPRLLVFKADPFEIGYASAIIRCGYEGPGGHVEGPPVSWETAFLGNPETARRVWETLLSFDDNPGRLLLRVVGEPREPLAPFLPPQSLCGGMASLYYGRRVRVRTDGSLSVDDLPREVRKKRGTFGPACRYRTFLGPEYECD